MHYILPTLQVALGLGLVIFVHELGHFLVAKACGVRCDKFFIGFDIGGLKLSRKWGETEYGIGILPLGGYVKMFGQEDNAGAIAEEIASSKVGEGDPDAKAIKGPGGETVWVHKRSYLAKSVPQRMAIISAGVIMNVLFAVVLAFIAFGVGVPTMPAAVGSTVTGLPAWEAGLHTGDRLIEVNGNKNPTFEDLLRATLLGDVDKGIDLVVEHRDGATESLNVKPKSTALAPRAGIEKAMRLRLPEDDVTVANSPAADLGDRGFAGGDQVLRVDEQLVDSYADLITELTIKRKQPVTFTVLRGGKASLKDPFGPLEGGEEVSFEVAANPLERLGIVPTIGPVAALETNGPAAAAGLEKGDVILSIDGVAIGAAPAGEEAIDPIGLDERLFTIAQNDESVELTVQRGDDTVELSVEPRVRVARTAAWIEMPLLSLDTIGAAVEIKSVIAAIQAGSPAAKSELRVGDRLLKAKLIPGEKAGEIERQISKKPIELGEKGAWPDVIQALQDRSPGFRVELTVAAPPSAGDNPGDAESNGKAPARTITLAPAPAEGQYASTRGFKLTPLKELRIVEDVGDRAQVAVNETFKQLSTVLTFLKKIGSQVSVKALGGPIEIAKQAGAAAFEGFGALLMSLVMLNANLAILNFLPIPVLDGGHMVFLLYEGITGRPVNDKVAIALQSAGLVLLLSLMLFVTFNDLSRALSWLF